MMHVLGDNQIIDLMHPGMYDSTYGGNPLATSLVPTTIYILREEIC